MTAIIDEYPELYLTQLRRLLADKFSAGELKTLVFDLGMDSDELAGETKTDKAQALVITLAHRGRVSELVSLAAKERPNITWPSPKPLEQICPYRGLQAFREEDAHLFFGRETFTERLVGAVAQQKLVTVTGPSGCGKSSVVFAGLLPRLRADLNWTIASFRPGSDPFRSLARALISLLDPGLSRVKVLKESKELADYLLDGTLSLNEVAEDIFSRFNKGQRLLLLVDQFEELYTLCPNPEIRKSFLDLLIAQYGTIDDSHGAMTLILTLRADFLSQAFAYRPFSDALEDRLLILAPMNKTELKSAVVEPALRSDIQFEEGLVYRILEDVSSIRVGEEAGNLPLLEFALTELWKWPSTDGQLTHTAYEAIGQVKGALAEHAESIYGRMVDDDRELMSRALVQLVQPGIDTGDTRRVVTKNELGDESWSLVDRLAGSDIRLLVIDRNEAGEVTAELVHEALIQRWGRLQRWIDTDRAFLTWRRQLRIFLDQRKDSQEDAAKLLRGSMLEEAQKWLNLRPTDISQNESDFILSNSFEQEQETKRDKELIRAGLILDIRDGRTEAGALRGADLDYVNLNGVVLARVDMTGIKLRGADLTNADLSEAKLCDANLAEADLPGSNLRKADLRGADLRGSNLFLTNLVDAIIDNSTKIEDKWRLVWEIVNQGAKGRNLSKTDLTGAEMSNIDLSRAILHQADLSRSRMYGADLQSADMRKANLTDANLTESNLSSAYLHESNLSGAALIGANLHMADLREANLSGAALDQANLLRADLQGANLSGARLDQANLRGADLHETIIDDSTRINNKWRLVWEIINNGIGKRRLYQADLREANLSEANLSEADLSTTDLTGANLSGADLRGADLGGTNLRKANLNESDLRSANLRSAHLDWANLKGVVLDFNIQIDEKWLTVWQIVNLGRKQGLFQVNLDRANLNGIDLSGTDLRESILRQAILNDAELSMVDLRGANLIETSLARASLTDADLSGADLNKADLSGADLSGANLSGVTLIAADLRAVNLSKANLQDAIYSFDTLWPDDFDPKAAGAFLNR